jgi:nanoRNase/pAp phosphatase (c-di-AMP/oligoRNAs hydrolase)
MERVRTNNGGCSQYDPMRERLALILNSVAKKKRVLILTHNNPDPDCLASAFAFRHLLRETVGQKAVIYFGGLIGRAENREMIRQLKIPVHPVRSTAFRKTDAVVLVDTQPGAGNNLLQNGLIPTVVIDHHKPLRGVTAQYLDIRPEYGATSTIVWEYMKKAKIDLSADIATAIAYAISSETQDLGREAGPADKKAYLEVFPFSSLRKLSLIYHPKLSWKYFEILHRAISKAHSKRNVIYCSLGDIPNPDFVHQVADLFLRVERKSWSLAMGRSNGTLYFSLRTTKMKSHAGRLMRRIIGKKGTAGGHDMMAGGRIEYGQIPPREIALLEEEVIRDFIRAVGLSPDGFEELLAPHAQETRTTTLKK